jgi:hypothetical protein
MPYVVSRISTHAEGGKGTKIACNLAKKASFFKWKNQNHTK